MPPITKKPIPPTLVSTRAKEENPQSVSDDEDDGADDDYDVGAKLDMIQPTGPRFVWKNT